MFKLILLAGMLATSLASARTIQLTTQNTVLFKSQVTGESVADAEAKLLELAQKRKSKEKLYLIMDSPGGSITAGENFIQFAKLIPNLETISIFAASMASAIVEGLPGKRLVTENGTLMFHRAKGGFQGQFETGEVESRLLYAKSIVYALEQRNATRMGKEIDQYKADAHDEMWLYGIDNELYGAADEVVDITCSKQLMDSKVITQVTILGLMNIDVVFSGCPLLTGAKLADAKADADMQDKVQQYFETYRQTGIFSP